MRIRTSDLMCLTVAWALTGLCTGAVAAAVAVQQPQTLADLPWLTIAGGCALSFAGGLINTTRAIVAAAKTGAVINIRVQLVSDGVVSAVCGLVTYAVVEGFRPGNPYFLLGALILAGAGGARVLDPWVDTFAARVGSLIGNKWRAESD